MNRLTLYASLFLLLCGSALAGPNPFARGHSLTDPGPAVGELPQPMSHTEALEWLAAAPGCIETYTCYENTWEDPSLNCDFELQDTAGDWHYYPNACDPDGAPYGSVSFNPCNDTALIQRPNGTILPITNVADIYINVWKTCFEPD